VLLERAVSVKKHKSVCDAASSLVGRDGREYVGTYPLAHRTGMTGRAEPRLAALRR